MALLITNEKTERAVIALANATGESVDVAIERAAEARLQRLSIKEQGDPRPVDMEKVYALLREIDAIPTIDHRTPDEILGYDENGLPT
jgi:antitoxin VapB